jgi:hypothetical protein
MQVQLKVHVTFSMSSARGCLTSEMTSAVDSPTRYSAGLYLEISEEHLVYNKFRAIIRNRP